MFSQSLFHQWWHLGLASLLAIVGAITGANESATAQIVPDNSLGQESSVVRPLAPNFNQIDGGARRGSNLFHSFEQFNVNAGQQVFFTPPSSIKNIISRVTGGSRSEILGTLGVLSPANMFLINPNGIIFGPNAQLNIGGSFVATTADAIGFGNQGFFSTKAQDAPSSLLVVNPSALLFNQITSQPIIVQSKAGLQLPANQSLLLVGGDVNLSGGLLRTQGGRVELGGLAGVGTVGLNMDGNKERLSFPQNVQLADVSLTNGAKVDVSFDRGGSGNVLVQGKRVTLADGSNIEADNLGSSQGGTLTVRASELVEVIGGSSLSAYTNGVATGGDLTIETGKLIVRDGALLAAATFNEGRGGNVTVRATDTVELSGTSANGENVSRILTQTEGSGDAGSLKIETGQLIVQGGARVSTSTTSSGQGGSLVVRATDSVQLIGASTSGDNPALSGLFASAQGSGKPGDLTIETGQLIVQDGARASASNLGSAQSGGTLTVNASELVQLIGTSPNGLDRSGLFVGTEVIGSAGELTINTQKLQVSDGAIVSARTVGEGRGGSVMVRASDSVELIGTSSTDGQIFSLLTSESTGMGAAGNLTIETGQLTIKDGGQITSQTNSGNGGNLTLSVKDFLLLRSGSQISTSAGNAQQPGDGGNITINAPNGFIIAVPSENSDITANAFTGSGGRITINSLDIFNFTQRSREDLVRELGTDDPNLLNPQLLQTNDITAFSRTNPTLEGQISINTPDIDQNLELVELPAVLADTSNLVNTSCAAFNSKGSSFIVTGRGGLPPSPDQPLTNDVVWTDARLPATTTQPSANKPSAKQPSKPKTEPIAIVPATGWVFNKDKGEVTLISHAPNATSLGSNPATCPTR